MPIYEYQCRECGAQVEVMQKISDPPPSCESCDAGEMKKRISAPAFQFKGDGWYVTDYARKDQEKKSSGEKKETGGDSGSSSESKSSETKSSSKSTETPKKTSSSSASGASE